MVKYLLRSLAILLIGVGSAHATCPQYTFSNGSTADANQINANFSCIFSSPSFTGPVGIGTTAPAGTLNVVGNDLFDNYGGVPNTSWRRADGTATSPTALIPGDVIGNFGFKGYIGSGFSTQSSAAIKAVADDTFSATAQGAELQFFTTPMGTATQAEVMDIANTGYVGIGTTSPSQPLEVNGNIQADNQVISKGSNAGFEALDRTNNGNFSFLVRSANITSLYDNTVGDVINYNSSGQVGIGTTSPTYTFQVNGSAGGSSAWNVVSDKRLKKDIKPITDALSTVEKLNPVQFRWRSVDERSVGKALDLPVHQRQVGLIAQEVADVIPEAVTVPKDKSDGVYSLQEGALIPILVAAMKEQQTEIEQLKSTVASLKPGK